MSATQNGSSWKKWDLHIHTPLSICQNYGGEVKFDDFITALEGLPEEVKVIGINDYYFIDGYEKVMEYKSQGRLENIEKIFPILEFRIDTFGSASESKFQKINLHILFNVDETDIKNEIKKIKEEFITQIKISKLLQTKSLSKENFINSSSDKTLKTGFNELIPNTDEVKKLIASDTWKDKTFLFLGYTEWNNLEKGDQLKLHKKDLFDLTDAFFTASQKDDLSKKEEVLDWFGNKPLLHSSDIHSFEELSADKYKCYTWIKADATFEGLRQITYEPNERLLISENKPIENIHKISKIALKFNENITINSINGNKTPYPFCFSEAKQDLYLSDYFNCFIGGRGSGKSSILNLIYKGISNNDTEFFKVNQLKQGNNVFDIKNNIDIDHSTDKIEFLGQNQIEEFATDYEKFSNAIYDRLENQKELEKYSGDINGILEEINLIINAINEKSNTDKKLVKLKQDLDAYNKVIDVIKGEKYKDIQDKIKIKQDAINEFHISRTRYSNFKTELETLIKKFHLTKVPKNEYDNFYNELLTSISVIKTNIDIKKFNTDYENKLDNELSELKTSLTTYLTEKGISQEKLDDLNKAQEGIGLLNLEMPKLEKQSTELLEEINKISLKDFGILFDEYKEVINKGIKIAELKLGTIKNDNVGEIKFQISFDESRAKEDLFDEFIQYFSEYKTDYKKDRLFELLFEINPSNILDGSKIYQDVIDLSNSGTTNGNIFLQSIFTEEANFQIYKMLIAKYFLNLRKYLKIGILYNERPIESSSFGQKCTVVILIMILFGTKPIMIDEPEAHLDSSLIADYLVDLIKQRKKERQIIFATHNANFVINGDAEQIFILEVEENKTNFIQTTIENIDTREKLLRLEGGKRAFELRERKYHF